MNRESSHLMRDSLVAPLSRDQSQSLIGYMKLVKELQKDEKDLLESLPDSALEKLAREGK